MILNTVSLLSPVLVLALSFWFGMAYPAEVKTEVAVRASKHEGFNRIVFEARDQAFIESTAVTSSQNQIRVQFPSNISPKVQGTLDLETSLRDNFYTIRVNAPFKIKVSQLSSPPRLSIDIITSAKEGGAKTPSPEITAMVIPNIRMVIDPGHGGYDLGILSGELREKDATLSLARSLEAALIKRNRTVNLTRKADQFLSITDRALFANQKSAEVFISIHLSLSNTFVIYTSPAESAIPDSVDEIFGMSTRQKRYLDKSKAFAEAIGKAIKDEFSKNEVMFRRMELPLLSSVGAAAVMVEIPGAIMSDQAAKSKLPDVFLRGVAAYGTQ